VARHRDRARLRVARVRRRGSSGRHVTVGVGLRRNAHRPPPPRGSSSSTAGSASTSQLVDDGRPRPARSSPRRSGTVWSSTGQRAPPPGRRGAVRPRRGTLRGDARPGPHAAPADARQGPRPAGCCRRPSPAGCARSTRSCSSRSPARSTTSRRSSATSTSSRPPTRRPSGSSPTTAATCGPRPATAPTTRSRPLPPGRAERPGPACPPRLDEARAEEAVAEAEAAATDEQLGTDRARRDALKASDAFRTAGQLEHLERSVRDLAADRGRAEARRHAPRPPRRPPRTSARPARQPAPGRRRGGPAAAAPRDRRPAAGLEWTEDDGEGDAAGRPPAGRAASPARRADLDAVRALLEAAVDADGASRSPRRPTSAPRQPTPRRLRPSRTPRTAVRRPVPAGRHGRRLGAGPPACRDRRRPRDGRGGRGDRRGRRGSPTLAEVWRGCLDGRRDAAASRRARLEDAAGRLVEQRRGLQERRQAILEERDDAPTAVDWRGHGRHGRSGAPLWRLVRFADDLDPAAAAGIEGALEAAGLLDAWVRPDGEVDTDAGDAFLVAGDGGSSDGGGSDGAGQRDARRRAGPRGAGRRPPEVVAGCWPASGWTRSGRRRAVGRDGRYRLGPLAGTHRPAAPRYVGATARAAHRASRIAALDAELAELDRDADRIASELREVEGWLAAADAATAALPTRRRCGAPAGPRPRRRSPGQARAALDAARPPEDDPARRQRSARRPPARGQPPGPATGRRRDRGGRGRARPVRA
jgi:hypothetical protein